MIQETRAAIMALQTLLSDSPTRTSGPRNRFMPAVSGRRPSPLAGAAERRGSSQARNQQASTTANSSMKTPDAGDHPSSSSSAAPDASEVRPAPRTAEKGMACDSQFV
jgi:hypothetical protein